MTYDSNVQRKKVSWPLKGFAADRRGNKTTKTEASARPQTLELKLQNQTKKENEIERPAEVTETSRIPQIVLLTSVHQKFQKVCRDTDTHTKTHSLSFALCAGQQLCLVQVEEQLMN